MSRLLQYFNRLLDLLAGWLGCLVLVGIGPVLGTWCYLRTRNFPLVPMVLVGINRRRASRSNGSQALNRRHVVRPGRLVRAWRFSGRVDSRWSGYTKWSSLWRGLPLAWNLLRGDLTLFGPQPLLLEDYLRLKRDFPDQTRAPLVKPGLMGLSQLDADQENVPGTWLRQRELDRRYVARRSLTLNLQILVFTLLEFLPGPRA